MVDPVAFAYASQSHMHPVISGSGGGPPNTPVTVGISKKEHGEHTLLKVPVDPGQITPLSMLWHSQGSMVNL